jgi:hypothetical protein
MTDIGDLVRFGNPSLDPASAPFTDLDGVPTNPSMVELTIVKPDQTELAYAWPGAGPDGSLTNESVGRFYYAVLIDQSGPWQFRLAGQGAVTAAAEGVLRVTPRQVV